MYTRRWASLLLWLSVTIVPVSQVAVASNEKAFMSAESGASAFGAHANALFVGPSPLRPVLRKFSANSLVQTSQAHILIGSGAKVGCCLPKSGATSVESG